MFDSIFSFIYYDCLPNETLHSFLKENVAQDIIEFGIPNFPSQLQIKIEILSDERFAIKLLNAKLPEASSKHCIAYSDTSIHCVDYTPLLTAMPFDDYLKSIRHECIHILQHLATRIPPQSAIWLYESVACARAEQRLARPSIVPNWFEFVTKFYALPNCYALAFEFGTGLLRHISIREIVALCDDFPAFENKCEKIYDEIFSK